MKERSEIRKLFKTKVEFKKEKNKGKKVKKLQNCIKTYIGENVIDSRYVGSKNNRQTYDIKCPKCPFTSNRLKQHTVKKHRCNANEAKLEKSKVRVLFSWAQKDKHGVAKPLTAQKMKFSIKDFFSKCERQKCEFLPSHLQKKSLMENFIFFAVCHVRNVHVGMQD